MLAMGLVGSISLIAISSSGSDNTTLTQNRRVISTSSGFFPSARVTVRGSSAIPQIGQEPGASRTISGCMGQVYVTVLVPRAVATGSSCFGARLIPIGVAGLLLRYLSGSALNFSRQPSAQK